MQQDTLNFSILEERNLLSTTSVFLGFPVAQLIKNPPAMWETWIQSLSWEDPLEKGRATHSSLLAWRISWTVLSMGSKRVGHNRATFTFTAVRARTMLCG